MHDSFKYDSLIRSWSRNNVISRSWHQNLTGQAFFQYVIYRTNIIFMKCFSSSIDCWTDCFLSSHILTYILIVSPMYRAINMLGAVYILQNFADFSSVLSGIWHRNTVWSYSHIIGYNDNHCDVIKCARSLGWSRDRLLWQPLLHNDIWAVPWQLRHLINLCRLQIALLARCFINLSNLLLFFILASYSIWLCDIHWCY